MVEIPRTEDFTAEAVEGRVLLNGPGLAMTLEPETALHVADLLTDAASTAIGQMTMAEIHRTLKPT